MRKLQKFDKLHIILFLGIFISLAFNVSFYISFNDLEKDLETITAPEEMEEAKPEVIEQEKTPDPTDSLMLFTVQSGDTLFKIFSDAGIAINDSYSISSAINKVYEVSKLKIGNQVEVKFLAEADKPEDHDYYSKVSYIKVITDDKIIEVKYDNKEKEYIANLVVIPLTVKEVFAHGTINDSLYLSAVNSGVSPYAIMDLIKLFSYNVDFQRDIKPGDVFEVYYNCLINEKGQKVRDGNIIYAAVTLAGKKKEIFRFLSDHQATDYYDNKGESIRKTLLKTPISGAKISSGFGIRKHPILGYSKMHKGLDYAAPRGTPVFAAGDGIIHFIKVVKNGYGKHLEIKHSSKYSTLYAHLDRFASGVAKGSRVSQGDIIGFVGSTGMATGPHLHYEVRERGQQVNPAKISFPKFPALTGADLQRFKNQLKGMEEKILMFKKKDANK
ncbi:M23 family metallopeptidase [Candidatus Jidaibacter acanthamoebae]|nr:M23 family metallopeptidase [Candidatus Jidaibacter acanthamoeba]